MKRASFITLWTGAVLCVLGGTAAGQFNGYEALSQWPSLPLAKTGVTAGLASSYDRTGGNDDFNYYQSPTGPQTTDGPTTIVTLTGPGVITRFWMPHATANVGFDVKMSIDGVPLAINTNSNAMLDGTVGYMTAPLVSTRAGGQVSYEPIVFQTSLVIESNNWWKTDAPSYGWAKNHHYYQYGYHQLPAGTVVTSYTGTLTAEQTAARADVTDMIANVGSNPAGASGSAVVPAQGAQSIPAGGTLALADLPVSGTIRRLNVAMAGASDAELDALRLRVRYDGRADNAVDVPVSHFFGAGHGRAPYKSLPLGTVSPDGFYCYWPMPFRQGVTVELYNAGGAAVAIDSAKVEYEAAAVAPQTGYLHAAYREEMTTAGQEYHQLLSAAGQGHYVGNLLYVQTPDVYRSILEGDDIITVDGTDVLHGTGLEDAYNGGYYYNHVLVQTDDGDTSYPRSAIGPYSGLLRMNFDTFAPPDSYVRSDQYRWLIGDCVPFTEGIDVKIENYGQRGGILFGSTAFYYVVPEPGTLLLLAAGAVAPFVRRRL